MATGVYFTDQKLKNADSAFWRQNWYFLAENVFLYHFKSIWPIWTKITLNGGVLTNLHFWSSKYRYFDVFWVVFSNSKAIFSGTTTHIDLKLSGYMNNHKGCLQLAEFYKILFSLEVIAQNPPKIRYFGEFWSFKSKLEENEWSYGLEIFRVCSRW